MQTDPRFGEALRLFNEKKYFECHEVMEELWLDTSEQDEYRDLYKGIIQAAAAIYQFDRGVLTGARSLFGTSVDYLKKYQPQALGLNIRKFIEQMESCFSPLKSWDGKSGLSQKRYSAPQLEFGNEHTG